MNKQRGFTLIEILVVVAIVAIIAAVAIPSYNSFIQKTRRTEATSLLMEIAGEQQRYYSENNSFASSLTELGYPSNVEKSESGVYTASIISGDASSFTATTARPAGSSQVSDVDCGDFSINSLGRKSVTAAPSGATADAVAAACW